MMFGQIKELDNVYLKETSIYKLKKIVHGKY